MSVFDALTSALTPEVQSARKLTFHRLMPDGSLEDPQGKSVQFNPGELAFSKAATFADMAVPGLAVPISQFVRGDSETLSFDLTFDSTDQGMGETAVGVTAEVDAFHKYVQIDGDRHATPLVRISWGEDFPGNAYAHSVERAGHFDAMVLSVARKFTLFAPNGAPLRAVVTLSLKEYIPLADQLAAINFRSPDHTRTHVVQEGESLPLIAHDAYGDVRQWPVIADFNGIDDVRTVVAGTVLLLPPTRGGGAA